MITIERCIKRMRFRDGASDAEILSGLTLALHRFSWFSSPPGKQPSYLKEEKSRRAR